MPRVLRLAKERRRTVRDRWLEIWTRLLYEHEGRVVRLLTDVCAQEHLEKRRGQIIDALHIPTGWMPNSPYV